MLHAREDYQERIQDSAHIIPEDEPVFLIRAQDKLAPEVVSHWAHLADLYGADRKIVRAAQGQVKAMRKWQKIHGSKVPDMPK